MDIAFLYMPAMKLFVHLLSSIIAVSRIDTAESLGVTLHSSLGGFSRTAIFALYLTIP